MTAKARYPAGVARPVAEALRALLRAACERIEIAGSLRRQRPDVGDIELVYIPHIEQRPAPASLLGDKRLVDVADETIAELERAGVLARRKSAAGHEVFGPKNKLMVHVPSGIPVDLFATTEACWWNYLVARTGGAETNIRIARAAQRRGWKWNPYGPGFTSASTGTESPMHSERAVFKFVGLPWLEPEERP